MKKLAMALVLSLVLTGGGWAGYGVQAHAGGTQLDSGLASRTKEEVARKYEELMPDLGKSVSFEEEPSIEAPYSAGKLSDEDLQAGLDAVNLVRYIAGLPDDITLNEDYNSLTQHASVVNAANDQLSHYPFQPADMDSDFFKLGEEGASKSNIGAGYRNLADSVIRGYMDDSDSSNISRVGHRRWVLNPGMTQTGFGYADASAGSRYRSYSAMYAFDRARAYDVEYVAWPAAVTPVELYEYTPAFSISLNSAYNVYMNHTTVTVHSQKENKDYVFGNDVEGSTAGVFYVDNSYMGMKGSTIIFMPNGHTFAKDDVLTIHVDGIEKAGRDASFMYTVELFSAEEMLADVNKEVSSIAVSGLTKTEYIEGESLSLDGGVVTVNYDNGTTEKVTLTKDMLSAVPDMTKIGSQTVTVNYGGKSATFTIVVQEKQLQEIVLTVPDKTVYTEGETLDLTGGGLSLVYNNGTKEDILLTTDMVSGYDSSAVGEQILTVSYGGFTETFSVTVEARKATGIEWVSLPDKTMYIEGQELDLSGAMIKVTFNNGTELKKNVTLDMISGYDKNSVGTQEVTVTANGKTTTFQVEVLQKMLTKIKLASNPSKMEYIVDESFDISGAQISLCFNDGEEKQIAVTEDMFDAPDMTTAGTKDVQIFYGGFTTVLEISVRDKQAVKIEMNSLPEQKEYLENKVGQTFRADGGSFFVIYDNGTKEKVELTAAMCSVDLTTAGKKTVMVSYNGFTTTFEVTVVPKSIIGVVWLDKPEDLTVKEGMQFSIEGRLVVSYDNGRSDEIELTEENVELVNYNPDQTGVQTVAITLKGYTLPEELVAVLSVEVEVIPKTAVGIQIDKLPVTQYTVGDEFDGSGLEISLVYDNNTTEKIDSKDIRLVVPDMTKAGEKEVAVVYQLNDETAFGASFTIQINDKAAEIPDSDDGKDDQTSTGKPVDNNDGKPGQNMNGNSGTGTNTNPSQDTAVKTGDTTGFGIWIMLVLVSAAGAAIVLKRNKYRN